MPQVWEDKWQLGDRLGKGGQGVTHVATSLDGNTKGALKYLKNNSDNQARGRMKREVSNLQALLSVGGNVPRVLDHNTEEFAGKRQLYVVMELIPGTTLDQHVETEGVFSVDDVHSIANQFLDTIELAHSESILHRDLKPQNVIVTSVAPVSVTIVDYGLSFNANDEDLTETLESFQNKFLDLPETNTPSGNMRDPRSDLTAFCGLLFYCLTGQRPGQLQDSSGKLPHKRPETNLKQILESDPRSTQLDRFFTRGFSPNIANRFQNAAELRQMLGSSFTILDPSATSDPIAKAAAHSELLRQNDRPTQLAIHRKNAGPLIKHLGGFATTFQNKLGNFSLSLVSNTITPEHDGLDIVSRLSNHYRVSVAQHKNTRNRYYAVASREDSCVLISANIAQTQPNRSQRDIEWKEIAWYQSDDPASIFDLVVDEFSQWLNESIDGLASEIMPNSAS